MLVSSLNFDFSRKPFASFTTWSRETKLYQFFLYFAFFPNLNRRVCVFLQRSLKILKRACIFEKNIEKTKLHNMCVQNTARDIQIRGDGPRQGLSAIVAYRRSANRCGRSGQQSARLGSYHLWADLCQGKYARWRQSRLDQSQVC